MCVCVCVFFKWLNIYVGFLSILIYICDLYFHTEKQSMVLIVHSSSSQTSICYFVWEIFQFMEEIKSQQWLHGACDRLQDFALRERQTENVNMYFL